MTQHIIITTAAIFGLLAVIFGAFGAHTLKKRLTDTQIQSFEVGVKYQMYHAIVLLILGYINTNTPAAVYWCFTLGIVLFSFSIYGLVLTDVFGNKLKVLGPITPIGGICLVMGWFFIAINSF